MTAHVEVHPVVAEVTRRLAERSADSRVETGSTVWNRGST